MEELPTESSEENAGSSAADRPIQDLPDRFRTKSWTKSALTFAVHQFIGMYGVPFTAPLVFSLGFKFLLLFGYTYSSREFYSKITEIPFFPVQVLFALVFGWLVGSALKNKSMLWVWVLPFAILVYSFASAPMSVLEGESFASQLAARFSHFLGWGCRPAQHCLDQILITLPFLSSLGYSLGALLARRMGYRTSKRKLTLALTYAGLGILLAIGIDLVFSVRQTGWHSSYWLIFATPVGLGTYLLWIGALVRQRFTRNARVAGSRS